jgi:hypothetical protein
MYITFQIEEVMYIIYGIEPKRQNLYIQLFSIKQVIHITHVKEEKKIYI